MTRSVVDTDIDTDTDANPDSIYSIRQVNSPENENENEFSVWIKVFRIGDKCILGTFRQIGFSMLSGNTFGKLQPTLEIEFSNWTSMHENSYKQIGEIFINISVLFCP